MARDAAAAWLHGPNPCPEESRIATPAVNHEVCCPHGASRERGGRSYLLANILYLTSRGVRPE